MTTEIHSSPAAQWLQGLLAKGAPSQIGSRSNPGAAELPRDSSRISAQAFQLNQAAGASTTAHARSGQPLAVSAPLPHHHVHIEDKKKRSNFCEPYGRGHRLASGAKQTYRHACEF